MKIKWDGILLFRILIVVALIFLVVYLNMNSPHNGLLKADIDTFNSGWNIKTAFNEDESLENLPIKYDIGQNNSLTITKTLPSNLSDITILSTRSSFQKITVYINEDKIYEHGNSDDSIYTKYPPSSFLYIPLKEKYSSQKITIIITCDHAVYSGLINEFIIGNEKECKTYNINQFRIRIVILASFIIFGAILIIVSLIIRHRNFKLNHYTYFGIFTILISIWMLSSLDLISPFFRNPYTSMYISYISIMFIPFPFILYLRHQMNNPNYIKVLDIIALIFAINHIGSFFFVWTGIIHIFSAIYVTVILIGFGLIAFIVIILFSITNDSRFDLIPDFIFTLTLTVTFIIEVFIYLNLVYAHTISLKIILVGLTIYIYGICIIDLIFLGNELEASYEIREKFVQNKLSLMYSQIQPHFIYNTLDAIRVLTKRDPDKAYDMIYDFSKHLRSNINAMSDNELILFSDEMKNILAYTNIEQVRFPKIEIIFDIQVEDFYVPTLTIQPLVENAIRHGVSKKFSNCIVTITTIEEFDCFKVKIFDTGVGFDITSASYNKGSVGLKNIKYRLLNLTNAFLDIQSIIGEGTKVLVTFPKSFNRKDIYEDNNS